jgi:hypothetical protein
MRIARVMKTKNACSLVPICPNGDGSPRKIIGTILQVLQAIWETHQGDAQIEKYCWCHMA